VTEKEQLTPIGEMLSKLPVDVVIGKMLIMGAIFHVSRKDQADLYIFSSHPKYQSKTLPNTLTEADCFQGGGGAILSFLGVYPLCFIVFAYVTCITRRIKHN
jgi:hypothetical protein